MHTQLKIEGMNCEHCVRAVDSALRRVDGVTNVQVTLSPGRAEVDHSESVKVDALIAAVEEEGYRAQGA